MKKLSLLIFNMFLFVLPYINAQELNCRLQINTQQITGTDKAVYDNFKTNVESFMNSTQWSNLQLKTNEKIECSMVFVFKKRDGDSHTCELQIQSQRPIYGTTLTTSLLNMKEDITFNYTENEVLTYNESMIDDNLTATLAFWAYVIIGLDFDSFSKYGGTVFYQKAKDIAGMAQGSLGELWTGQEDKNHWGWINALTDENQVSIRTLLYNYHRNGLDEMYKDVEKGREQITQSLTELKAVKKNKPRSPLLSNFIDTKADELANIYSKAPAQEKLNVYNMLSEIYPASSNRLQAIKTRQQ
jgi:hypothetical protein